MTAATAERRCHWCRSLVNPPAGDPDPMCPKCGRYLLDRRAWPERRRTPREPNRRPEHITHARRFRIPQSLRPLCNSTWHTDTDLSSDDQLVTCPECWRLLRKVRP